MSTLIENPRLPKWVAFPIAAVIAVGAFLAAIVVVPFLKVVGRGRAKRSPSEVAEYLEKFIDGTQSSHDWDDFEVPIRDRRLDKIRLEAMRIALPIDERGRTKLAEVLERTKALKID